MVWENAVHEAHAAPAALARSWLAVGRRGMVLEQRTHATPAARRTRCLVAPPALHTHQPTKSLVSRGHSSSGRASGCRPEGCELETRWPRSRAPVPPSPSGAHAVLHTPRAGGAAGRGCAISSANGQGIVDIAGSNDGMRGSPGRTMGEPKLRGSRTSEHARRLPRSSSGDLTGLQI